MTKQISVLKVHIAIAVNDSGTLSVFNGCYETDKIAYKRWRQDLQNSFRLWTIKHIHTLIPLPIQFEDQTVPEDPGTMTRIEIR